MSDQLVSRIEGTGGVLCTERVGNYYKVKVLVIVETYPLPDGGIRTSNYFHERNKYYKKNEIDVDVINFSAPKCYELDEIQVFNLKEWEKMRKNDTCYDVLISHAPNLKHHLPFLKKYGSNFKQVMFFFHGQEVLKINEVYPEPYDFVKTNSLKKLLRNLYDNIKFMVWSRYFPRLEYKSQFVFVSESLKSQFFSKIRIEDRIKKEKIHIIHNSIGGVFEKARFDVNREKKYDFITVRSNMDSSTYCMDLLTELANKNPQLKFLLIGEGKYFEHYARPENITVINRTFDHKNLINKLQECRAAIMLTRNDTQGVMSCELASTGMPLITSDINVCREVFSCFPNVRLINNDVTNVSLQDILKSLEEEEPYAIVDDYYSEKTIGKECRIIKDIVMR